MATTDKAAPPSTRLYVRWSVDEDMVRNTFAKFGKVSDVRVMGRAGQAATYGFVTFETQAQADAALAAGALNNVPLKIEYCVGAERKKGDGPRARGGRTPAAEKPARERRPRREPAAASTEDVKAPYVALTPDPVATKPGKDQTLLSAGPRKYGRSNPKEGTIVAKTQFSATGAIAADFKLGSYQLRLLSVNVRSEPTDTRVKCRVYNPATSRTSDVYLRVRPDDEGQAHSNLQLTPASEASNGLDFVTLESIQVDRATGLWSNLTLALAHTA